MPPPFVMNTEVASKGWDYGPEHGYRFAIYKMQMYG